MTEEIPVLILEDGQDDTDNMNLLFAEDSEMGPFAIFSHSIPFLKRVRELKYGVLVLDYKLSEGSTGADILEEIKSEDEEENFFTIVHTGFPTVAMMIEIMRIRPNDFVIKGDGEAHYHQLIAIIKKGKHRIEKKKENEKKRIEKEEKMNTLINSLAQMARAFGVQPMKDDGTV